MVEMFALAASLSSMLSSVRRFSECMNSVDKVSGYCTLNNLPPTGG